MAAIIFISIGVIASFFCAIVDGIIASEFIVSITCIYMPALKRRKHKLIYPFLSEQTLTAHIHTPDLITQVSRDRGASACQIRNFVDVISQNYQSHHDSRQIDQTNWSQCLPCRDGETFGIAGLIKCVQTLLCNNK